jgi:putative acetyltransferase
LADVHELLRKSMIRPELPSDVAAIRAVNLAAFPTQAEADLVDLLRANGHLAVSLVAEEEGEIRGQIAFSPVTIAGTAGTGSGLAPVAVLPAHQNQGLGSELIRRGIETCRLAGFTWLVVLGEPRYYGRYGFRPAAEFQLQNEYGVGDEFMALELQPDALRAQSGLVRYCAEFAMFG